MVKMTKASILRWRILETAWKLCSASRGDPRRNICARWSDGEYHEPGRTRISTVMSQLMVQDYTVPIIAVPAKGGNVVYRARKTTKGSGPYLTRRSPINETSARQFSSWRWWKLILPASYEVAKDKKAEPYLSQYGAFDFFGNAVGDFGYVAANQICIRVFPACRLVYKTWGFSRNRYAHSHGHDGEEIQCHLQVCWVLYRI